MSTEYLPEERLIALAITQADRDTPRFPRKGAIPAHSSARRAFAHDLGTGRIVVTSSQLRAARLVYRTAYLTRVRLIAGEEQVARAARHKRRTGRPWVAST